MFVNMTFVELTFHIIYVPDFVVINTITSSKINANCFGSVSEQVTYPFPSASIFLMITELRICLTWLRQQPTQHILGDIYLCEY